MTSRSDVPGKVMYCGPGRNLRRQAPGSDCPAHNYLPLNEAMSLSVGRKKPRFRVGGRTASSISRFCEGSVRRRSEEHTSELQSHHDLVCRLVLEKKK